MEHDDLDLVLSKGEKIVPSSGFVVAVMDAVRREAAEPPPIPFPWMRALTGLAASILALAFLVVALVRGGGPTASSWPDTAFQAAMAAGADWIVLALLLSLLSVTLAMRLTRIT